MKKIILLLVVTFGVASCKDVAAEKAAQEKAKQATVDSMKLVMEKQRAIDSMKTVMAEQEARQQQASLSSTATTPQKKGMSNTAKGALIGAGVGAVTGAVVSKKKGEGAIIGGLAGAAVGAGTGAVIDSKKKK
ncbi:glycine zipper family protein [Flavobacterium phycosphaerae]|uniref:glycine zipper family protein n=1 Tax=Flavobacterium phycosphaerae TaxID=2697515 RepID=UPI00138A335E|nr:YMGG-like glycine zipper-containing protein [Flavobacterium phycosphaerae]